MNILRSLLPGEFDSRVPFFSWNTEVFCTFRSAYTHLSRIINFLRNLLPLKGGGLRWGSSIIVLMSVNLISYTTVNSTTQIKVGSKKFTESVILGELVSQLARNAGIDVQYREELGGTRVLWNALLRGDIDIYPEYTGTIIEEILSKENISGEEELRNALSEKGILVSEPLGFNNTYALGMKEEVAEKLGITKISDLRRYPNLKFGFTNEFMNRGDGWLSLKTVYHLPQRNITGLDHDLAYRGVESGDIDVVDLYSTDAEIEYYNLRRLKDDLKHFTNYNAVLLYRSELKEQTPEALRMISKLQGKISEGDMIKLNALVKIVGEPESVVAAKFLKKNLHTNTHPIKDSFFMRLWHNTLQHLFLVAVSLSAAILISIPLGIWAYQNERLGRVILGIVGIIQTIPSLALLVFMIPLLGIGATPAIVALFLYSLLPIVRNTYTGLHDIPSNIRESAEALGLSYFARLRLVELPMASRSIIGGIKTSAVINVGTATLGALIGAGGYGQPILTGIRLDNIPLILEGAIPAAVLALLVQGLFDLSELVFVPKGLRLKSE
jgi:osmoprotectant transport system substrate-binding protein/osmoprotectant transport system permease protein